MLSGVLSASEGAVEGVPYGFFETLLGYPPAPFEAGFTP